MQIGVVWLWLPKMWWILLMAIPIYFGWGKEGLVWILNQGFERLVRDWFMKTENRQVGKIRFFKTSPRQVSESKSLNQSLDFL